MQIDIKGTNLELTDALKDYVNDKIGSLDKFFDEILEARVDIGLTTKHHQKGKIFRAEVNLEVPQKHVIRAEAEREDLYMAINEVKDDLQRQIKKMKEKMRGNYRY
ncbi:MAG: ribosomal subunit interface protein [Candidatus Buchananbacteria bacterium RBG_13_39_9]|jgi:putative sigma-54 modulation protein|uniref:Ribosomal subunit interface protein n=1 Tax=Candidatus Buchananbacteria bacterium RBG_13_39_9 TaxID=1797531 RepID=A0A1G1XRG4_9BACT|nr:MAG: ribosomal subunit interface protein [Candidatus Buchananbacteria bacterium RBG_13_39_9]